MTRPYSDPRQPYDPRRLRSARAEAEATCSAIRRELELQREAELRSSHPVWDARLAMRELSR